MKKKTKKLLVMLLTVAMVFTYMAVPVYADEVTEAGTDEVITDTVDTPEAGTEPADGEGQEVKSEPGVQEEPAPEEVQEEPAAEVVQEGTADGAGETAEPTRGGDTKGDPVELADGTYTVPGLSTAVLSMYHFDANAARVVIKGDDAWLITSIDGVEEPTTLKRFDGMAYGPQSQILDPSDETNHTLVAGTPVADVIENYDEDGETVVGRTFVLPVPKSVFESYSDIYYMIKYKAGYNADHDGDWYKASGGDYYLTGYTLEFEKADTTLPTNGGDEPDPEPVALTITNNTSMFKAVTATAVANADGSAKLTFALSGTGYHWLYMGTYEEALAANSAIAAGIAAEEGSDKLIKGYVNDSGQWEFQMTIGADQLGKEVPVVAISDSYYQKFLSGQNPQERAYYPRQFNLDMDAETLVTGDYDMTYDFTLTTALDDFKAVSPVSVHIVGGPNSNNYMVEPTLVMSDAAYDKVTFPTVVGTAISTATADLTDGKFAISMVNQPNKAAFSDKTPLTFTFHVAADAPYEEAGTDIVRMVTFDQVAKTITVEGTALTPKSNTEQYIITANVTKTSPTGTAFTMFIPNLSGATASGDPDDNKVNLFIDEEGVYTLQFTNYKTSYPAIYMGTLAEGQNSETFDSSKLKVGVKEGSIYSYTFNIDPSLLGTSFPIALAKKASPGTANSDWYTTQLYMTLGDELMSVTVYNVIKQIDALPAAENITVLDKNAIEAARAAYDALTAEQKAQVTNLDKLVAAEAAYAALPEKDEDTIAVENAINDLIQKYTDVNETTAAAVTAARAAYDALSAQQKAYISEDTYQKLARAEACVKFADPSVRSSGIIVDAGINTDSGNIVGAVLGGPDSDTYMYIYADSNTMIKKVSGTVSQSTQKVIGGGKLMETIWILGTTEPHGREFVIQLTDLNGNVKSDEIAVKVPSAYGAMAEGTYEVAAVQTPSSSMRKFQRSTITSDGSSMTVEFVMPNTTYGKIFLGTKEAAEAAAEGFIEPTGTEATSGTTGVGNVYTIPLESMYAPITISYCNTTKNTWTQETVVFVVDEKTQAYIDAFAALNLNTYFYVTAAQREQVETASALYDQLNDNQKAIVSDSYNQVLKKVVAMFVIADKVAAQIEALPVAADMTAEDAANVLEVKNAYDNMGKDPELMEVLNTSNGLQNSQLEKLIAQDLKNKLNADVAKANEFVAASVATIIDALPDAGNVTKDDIEAIRAAREAYDALTADQKALVGDLSKLEACEAVLADYSEVDAAIATVPADLTIYTDETAAAVTAAINAVDRLKMATEQADVDAMAAAINTAVAALKEKTDISGATIDEIPAQTYSGKALTPDVTVKLGEETLIKDTDYTVSFKNNTNVGTANVTVTGKGNYGGTVTATFEINVKKITPKVTLSKTILTYTGKAQKPSVTVYDGKTKLAAANYTATIQTGKNIGTYNVRVTLKGNYSGTKTVSYTIGPKGATIKAPKSAKKAFTAKWAAQKAKMPKARIAGYQVQYATDKAFTKNVKSVTVKGYKKTSRKISKLKAKTTYYVRVRTYIKVSGKTYYSTWSAIKSVKTK